MTEIIFSGFTSYSFLIKLLVKNLDTIRKVNISLYGVNKKNLKLCLLDNLHHLTVYEIIVVFMDVDRREALF